MKNLKLPLLIVCALLLSTCSKRLFVHVQVEGRVVSGRTGLPLTAAVNLWVGKVGSSGTTVFVSSRTRTDGTFSIKSRAQWNGNNYYLEIIPDSVLAYSSKYVPCPINKGKTASKGDIKL